MSAMKIRAKAIKELEDKLGRVTPEIVFKAAHSKKHPLHNDFVWDKDKAWRERNLDIARGIISSVRVITKDTTRVISSPSYVRDPSAASNQQGYISVVKLRDEKEESYEALLYETVRLQAQLERCREIAEALNLQNEVKAIIDSVLTLSARLRKGPAKPDSEMRASL